jgi:GNAT superfamily N-acetyltransferase
MSRCVEVRPVTPERWPDMVDLFERRGPRGGFRNSPASGCWCMYWRRRSNGNVALNKRRMASIVREGSVPGLIAYVDEVPSGWVSVAPREAFPVLLRSPQYRPRDEDADVWAIVCFTIDRPVRRSGIASALLDGAVARAFANGAAALEAYPHVGSGDDYMGSIALYEQAGFARVRDANKRAVYRLAR